MKKVFLWILVVIIVVVLGVWGYLTARQSASGDAQIHVQSRAVVRISVDRMLTSLVKNALIHPGTYFGAKKEPKRIAWSGLRSGNPDGISPPMSICFQCVMIPILTILFSH